jgi:KEOPS complex subunit Cgi121
VFELGMLKHIEEVGTYVEITGFKNIKIKNTEEFVGEIRGKSPPGSWIQFFNPTYIATWEHLYFAVLNALLSFSNTCNISKSMPMECLLYASAQRQIKKAIRVIGIKPDLTNVAIAVVGKKPDEIQAFVSIISKHVGSEPDETILEITEEKTLLIRKVFEINENELAAVMKKNDVCHVLVNLVIEKMALMSTRI